MDHKRIYLNLVTAMLATTAIVACTEKRSEYFAQGQGQNLVDIKTLDKKYYLVTEGIQKKASNSAANEFKQKENSFGIQIFDIVKIKDTNSDLIKKYGKLEISGPEKETKYTIEHKLTEKMILVRKIAKKEQLPSFELRSAEALNDGNYAVTLLGCPVSYVKVENQLNRNLEKTKQLTEVRVDYQKDATHLKVDDKRCREFTNGPKSDVFPAELFDGEWYFSETIVKTDEKWKMLEGWEVGADFRSKKAQRIKFLKFEDSIQAVNENVDARISSDDINKKSVVTIPVLGWHDFKIDNSDDIQEISDKSRFWRERKFVQLNLKYMYSGAFPFTMEGSTVVSIEFDQDKDGNRKNDYFSITLQKPMPGEDIPNMRIKYAFLRASPRNYSPRNNFRDDEKIFGFFTANREITRSFENDRKGDDDKSRFMTRFNPQRKVLEFHFSDMTKKDPHLREVAGRAIKVWQETFQKAGIDMKLTLVADDKQDVGLGDLRYNIINIVESVGTGSLIGVGPSVTDPFTGEIIAATANIQLTSIKAVYTNLIRAYIRSQLGVFKDNYLCLPNSSGKCNTFEKAAAVHVNKIQKRCPEVDSYITSLKPVIKSHEDLVNNGIDSKVELEQIRKCVDFMSEDMLVSSLVHELGHNFGLRHNFKGSVDKLNFWSTKLTDGIDVETSAVMDYLSPLRPELLRPGKYELAAILFGYADKIIEKGAFNGDNLDLSRTHKIDPTRSLKDNFAKGNIKMPLSQMHPFAYCTDDDVRGNQKQDPMCNDFDAGTTPVDIANHIIEWFEYDHALQSFKYDKQFSANGAEVGSVRTGRFYWPLKEFYDRWRTIIYDRWSEDKYFEKMSISEFKESYDTWLKEDETTSPYGNKGYGAASLLAYKFFKQLYFTPDRHCVVKKGNSIDLVLLQSIRKFLGSASIANPSLLDKTVVSCASPLAQERLKDMGYDKVDGRFGTAYHIDEVGIDLNDSFYAINSMPDLDVSESKRDAPFDVMGLKWDQEHILKRVILQREKSIKQNIYREFFPSMLDEPTNRKDFLTALVDNLITGIILKIENKDGRTTATLLRGLPDGIDRFSTLPADIKIFPKTVSDSKALADYPTIFFQTWNVNYLADAFNQNAGSRMALSFRTETAILKRDKGDPSVQNAIVSTQSLSDSTHTLIVESENAFIAKMLVSTHAKLNSRLTELKSLPASPEVSQETSQTKWTMEAIESLFAPFVRAR